MKRFEVIQNIPSPYRLHLFNEMWRQLKEREVEFHVNFMSDMSRGHAERPLSWRDPQIDFPHKYWNDYGISHYHFNPGLVKYIRQVKPDYMLVGSTFDTFTTWAVSAFCRSGVRCAWSEGNTKTTGEMGGLRGAIKRSVFSQYQLVGVPGSDAAKYILLHQKRTKRRMPKPIYLPNLVDETRFKPRGEWDQNDILEIRKIMGADDDTRVCLTPARLEPVKGLSEWLSLLTPKMVNGWKLIIMGQGALHDELIKLTKRIGIDGQVKILEFVPYADMPKYYASADLMLLPSKYDPNPLSVVEALHSGLPIALSNMAGNVEEGVTPGSNGWTLPVDDVAAFKSVLCNVFSTEISSLRRMGDSSLNCNAKFWDTPQAVSRFLDAFYAFDEDE